MFAVPMSLLSVLIIVINLTQIALLNQQGFGDFGPCDVTLALNSMLPMVIFARY